MFYYIVEYYCELFNGSHKPQEKADNPLTNHASADIMLRIDKKQHRQDNKMKKDYIISHETIKNDFMYVHSPISRSFTEFTIENGCASNRYNEDIKNWDYISIISKQKYTNGTTASTVCSFDDYGAPLIVLSDDITLDENNRRRYGLHFEVVAYEDGINVWHIIPFPENVSRPINPTLIGKLRFKIEDESKIDLKVTVKEKKLLIEANGNELVAEHPEIPESFHIGITACEGVNHFYSFSIED